MPILVVNLITCVTIVFFAGSYEWAYRRLAREAALQRVSLRDRIRLASICTICILPFLAWGLYCSFQPWGGYALAFTIVVVTPVTLLYLLVRGFIVRRQLRRLRLAAARAKAPAATEGEV